MPIKTTIQNNQKFYWDNKQVPDNYAIYRTHVDFKRKPEDISKEEVANAVVEVVKNQISLPEEDLVRETAKVFSYSRIGVNVNSSMIEGIKYAVKCGKIKIIDDRYTQI